MELRHIDKNEKKLTGDYALKTASRIKSMILQQAVISVITQEGTLRHNAAALLNN